MNAPALQVESLAVGVGAFALTGIELSVNAGECCVILGPNGAGKSVLLETLAGFQLPRAGRVRVRGREVTELAPEQRGMALVFQDFALFPHLNVLDNVRFALKHRHGKRCDGDRVEELLQRFDLTRFKHRRPQSLSGGERQKVALARAMAMDPDVFLFDEAASALDARTRMDLQEQLKAFLRAANVPAVYVTHDHTEARALADRVVILHEGRVVQAGTPDEVFNRPASRFVAQFVGVDTIAAARVVTAEGQYMRIDLDGTRLLAARPRTAVADEGVVCIRAENVRLQRQPPAGDAVNVVDAAVVGLSDRGPYFNVELDAGFRLNAYVMKHSAAALQLARGARLWAQVSPEAVHLIRSDRA